MLVVFLDLHRRKDERALRVDVLGGAHIGGRQRVAAIGLVALGEHREAVDAVIVDDRHQDRMIRRMRAAVIGRIVEKCVAAFEAWVVVGHRPAHDLRPAEHMDGQALGGSEQLVIGGQHGAGKVMRDRQDARAAGAEERIGHLPRDAVEPRCQHRHADAVDVRARDVRHGLPYPPTSMTRLPETSRTALAPGSITIEVKLEFDDGWPDDFGTRWQRLETVDFDRAPVLRPKKVNLPRWEPRCRLDRLDAARLGSSDPATDLGVPADCLDRRSRIAHRKDLLVGPVKIGEQPCDVRRREETRNLQRHFDLPGLVRVARLSRPVDRAGRAGRIGKRLASRFEPGEDCVHTLAVEGAALRMEHGMVAGGQIRDQRACGGKSGPDLGDKHPPAAKPPRDRHAVQAAGAAPGDIGRIGGIDALVDGHVHDRLDHVLGGELDDRGRGLRERSGRADRRRPA